MPKLEKPRPNFLGYSTGPDDLQKLKEFEKRCNIRVDIQNDQPDGLVEFVRITNLDELDVAGVLIVESSHSKPAMEFAVSVLKARRIRLLGVESGRKLS